MSINVDFTFDNVTYRNFMNGFAGVLHGHHYMCLTTKLAEDLADVEGPRILRESLEDSIRPLLDEYFAKDSVASPEERLKIGEEHFSVMGLGRLVVTGDVQGGEVRILRSHVDDGWINKWGKHSAPINHIACGYAAALFAAAFGKSPRSYAATETTSIAMGEPEGKLVVAPA
jgi:hypothetical protein